VGAVSINCRGMAAQDPRFRRPVRRATRGARKGMLFGPNVISHPLSHLGSHPAPLGGAHVTGGVPVRGAVILAVFAQIALAVVADALIRQLSLDCGYSSSALRERIYCNAGDDPMAGLLIDTASSDSEGPLGGLVDQAQPYRLGPLLAGALNDARYRASDSLGARFAHRALTGFTPTTAES